MSKLCAEGDGPLRAAAAEILVGLEDGPVRAATMLGSPDMLTRATAVAALGKMGSEVITEQGAKLAALLEDSQQVVRQAAVSALSRGGAALAPHCTAALRSKSARAREAALETLGALGLPAAGYAAEVAALLEDKDWQVPTAAATALTKLGPGAAKPCGEVLRHCEPVARGAAAEALLRIGGEEAADAAVSLLPHAEAGVRRHALEVLGGLGRKLSAPHVPAIKPLVADESKDVRVAARSALVKLGLVPLVVPSALPAGSTDVPAVGGPGNSTQSQRAAPGAGQVLSNSGETRSGAAGSAQRPPPSSLTARAARPRGRSRTASPRGRSRSRSRRRRHAGGSSQRRSARSRSGSGCGPERGPGSSRRRSRRSESNERRK